MSASAAKYQHDDLGDTSDRPLKDCAETSRQCVRKIHQYKILSVEWINLLDDLKRLSRLVQLEGRMMPNTKVSEAQGRNRDSDGTLWDQEQHETAIRVLVEEAKVNLCLRIMHDFKKWSYDNNAKADGIREAVEAYAYQEIQVEQKLYQFEETLGALLWRAFVHVETLQLMDIPLLIEHCSVVLKWCSENRDTRIGMKMQETLVLYYFSSLMKHAEALNNRELLAKAREHRLPVLAFEHVLRNSEEFPVDLVFAIATGFAALCDNEDFGTQWESFFEDADGSQNPEIKRRFLEMEEKVADPIIKESTENKRKIRPLLDFFKTIRRSLGMS
jgi:hypothetical protein